MPIETRDVLSIWTITKSPRDFPGLFVARRHIAHAGATAATDDLYSSHAIEPLRALFRERGLARIPRAQQDDPVIVESWI